jgi:hypothetical protein
MYGCETHRLNLFPEEVTEIRELSAELHRSRWLHEHPNLLRLKWQMTAASEVGCLCLFGDVVVGGTQGTSYSDVMKPHAYLEGRF